MSSCVSTYTHMTWVTALNGMITLLLTCNELWPLLWQYWPIRIYRAGAVQDGAHANAAFELDSKQWSTINIVKLEWMSSSIMSCLHSISLPSVDAICGYSLGGHIGIRMELLASHAWMSSRFCLSFEKEQTLNEIHAFLFCRPFRPWTRVWSFWIDRSGYSVTKLLSS